MAFGAARGPSLAKFPTPIAIKRGEGGTSPSPFSFFADLRSGIFTLGAGPSAACDGCLLVVPIRIERQVVGFHILADVGESLIHSVRKLQQLVLPLINGS